MKISKDEYIKNIKNIMIVKSTVVAYFRDVGTGYGGCGNNSDGFVKINGMWDGSSKLQCLSYFVYDNLPMKFKCLEILTSTFKEFCFVYFM